MKPGKKRLCRLCLRRYKVLAGWRRRRGFPVAFGRGNWPESLYHDDHPTRRACNYHAAAANKWGSARRATKLNASPPWADKHEIAKIYRAAAEATRLTGVPHEVDHVVPLMGLRVTGLHVPENLRVISARENRRKNNHFP